MTEKQYLMFAISDMDTKIAALQQRIKDLRKERLALKIKADVIFSPVARKVRKHGHLFK
jgi:hypothetical protein